MWLIINFRSSNYIIANLFVDAVIKKGGDTVFQDAGNVTAAALQVTAQSHSEHWLRCIEFLPADHHSTTPLSQNVSK